MSRTDIGTSLRPTAPNAGGGPSFFPPRSFTQSWGCAVKLTPKQAAEQLHVSAGLIYQWCNERRLVHYRMGGLDRRGRILIEQADLDAFAATLRVGESAAPASGRASSGSPAAPFSVLNQTRLAKAWKK